jgi:hypothetical protein
MTFPATHADHTVCRLVTVGRVSGREHDIEMWFGATEDRMYFISGNGPGADWYRNGLAAGSAVVRFGARSWRAATHDVVDPAERRIVGQVMGAKYGGWGGDPEIGLTEHAWTWVVPALGLSRFREI